MDYSNENRNGKSSYREVILNEGKPGADVLVINQSGVTSITGEGRIIKEEIEKNPTDNISSTSGVLQAFQKNASSSCPPINGPALPRKHEKKFINPLAQTEIDKIYKSSKSESLARFSTKFNPANNTFLNNQDAYEQIAKVAKYLQENPNAKITLWANTSDTASGTLNDLHKGNVDSSNKKIKTMGALLDARNDALLEALVRFGVSPKRIKKERGNSSGMFPDMEITN